MLLALVLILLVLALVGGFAVHPLLFLLIALAVIVFFFDRPYQRW